MKTCTKCGKEKDLDQFAVRKNKNGIRQSWCRECFRLWNKEAYRSGRRKKQVLERAKKQKAYLQAFVRRVKLRYGCSKCGYKKHYAAIDFHHVEEKDKVIGQLANNGCSIATMKAEMRKCILLCANCHREYHHGPVV